MYLIKRTDKLGNEDFWDGKSWDFITRATVSESESNSTISPKIFINKKDAEFELNELINKTTHVSPNSASVIKLQYLTK
jgi:hypothetical protein